MGKKQERHGLKKLPEYSVWVMMKQRCHNPRNKGYPYYGALGIKVCPQWRESCAMFLRDVGRRPEPSLSLDRINNNKGYEPGNVRWATRAEQSRNRRHLVRYEFGGQNLLLSEWAKISKVRQPVLTKRMQRGWTIAEALQTPVGSASKAFRMLTLNGRTKSIKGWADESGVVYETLYWRLRQGIPLEKALQP